PAHTVDLLSFPTRRSSDLLPFVIRAAVVEGVATATEVSTIGIAYSVLAGLLLYRKFDFARLPGILIETATLSGAILFIIGCATADRKSTRLNSSHVKISYA